MLNTQIDVKYLTTSTLSEQQKKQPAVTLAKPDTNTNQIPKHFRHFLK